MVIAFNKEILKVVFCKNYNTVIVTNYARDFHNEEVDCL